MYGSKCWAVLASTTENEYILYNREYNIIEWLDLIRLD